MNSHRGISLTEVLVVASMSTVILTLTGQIIHRMNLIQANSTNFYRVERDALRLAQQFRHDVHRADRATLDIAHGGQRLTLQPASGPAIEYQFLAGLITRRQTRDDGQFVQDRFEFSPTTGGGFSQLESPTRLALTLQSQLDLTNASDDPGPSPQFITPVCLQVEAALARQHRAFLQTASAEVSP